MIVYHGTTRRAAREIARDGFQPRSPSRRVWFSRGKSYAKQRAHAKSRRTRDRPIVLAVDIDLKTLRQRYGSRQVRESGGVISINGNIPASSLRSHYGLGIPESAEEIARWINAVLGVKAHKGVSARHKGVLRLARWVDNRLATQPHARIGEKELLARAAQWLPECFAGVEIDFEHLRVWPKVAREAAAQQAAPPVDRREEEATACLESDKPQRQVRGLRLLADLADPDLFEWCVLLLGEGHPSAELRSKPQSAVGILKVMRRCEDIQPEVLAPYAASEHKAVRGAAIEVLVLCSGEEAPKWFWRGLTDPVPHVRLSAAKFLDRLDPRTHRDSFEVALYDPHPQVAQAARKLTQHMGFEPLSW